jgi:hypothetical protein
MGGSRWKAVCTVSAGQGQAEIGVTEKWPRHYAAEIAAMKTREQRREALNAVPSHLREWVAYLVQLKFQQSRKQHV